MAPRREGGFFSLEAKYWTNTKREGKIIAKLIQILITWSAGHE